MGSGEMCLSPCRSLLGEGSFHQPGHQVQHLAARRAPLRIMSFLASNYTGKLLQMNCGATHKGIEMHQMCKLA